MNLCGCIECSSLCTLSHCLQPVPASEEVGSGRDGQDVQVGGAEPPNSPQLTQCSNYLAWRKEFNIDELTETFELTTDEKSALDRYVTELCGDLGLWVNAGGIRRYVDSA